MTNTKAIVSIKHPNELDHEKVCLSQYFTGYVYKAHVHKSYLQSW